MKIIIDRFPNAQGINQYALFCDSKPVSPATTDEQTTYAYARELLHLTTGNELLLRDFESESYILLDRS